MKKHFYLLIFLSILSLQAQAQEYKYHSVFLYNFTKYIQWPSTAQSGDFVIGVLGKSPITAELEKIAQNKTVGNQKIVIKQLKAAGEAATCQMLFIPETSSQKFEEVAAMLKNKPVLLITERHGMAQKGSTINFVMDEGKMRFELNQTTAQSAGLKVSSQLASMAVAVM